MQQGLKDEHKRYEDEIVEYLLNMKNRTKVNDLTFEFSDSQPYCYYNMVAGTFKSCHSGNR